MTSLPVGSTSGAIMTSFPVGSTSGAIMTSLPVGKNASNLHEFTAMTSLPVCDVTSGARVTVYYY